MSPRILRRRPVLVALAVLLGVALAASGLLAVRGFGSDEPVRPAAQSSAPPLPVTSTPPPPTSTTTPPPPPTTTTPPPPVTTTITPPPPRTTTTTSRRSTTSGAPRADTSLGGQVLALVNQERAAGGCPALSTDSRLTTAAQKHSDDMSARGYFSHDTPEGVSFADRITAAGYPRPAAENIAKGSTTAAQTVRMWMNSDGHRRNILNCSYTKLGVGVAKSGWYWTQDFGF